MKKWWIAALTVFLAISMAIGISVALASGGSRADASQSQKAQELEQEQDVQEPSYQSSITVPEPGPASLDSMAKITADQAREAALAASPGAAVTQVELDNENGNLVWSVEFSNGVESKVDAGNGQVIYTEQSDSDESGTEQGQTTDSPQAEENESGTNESVN